MRLTSIAFLATLCCACSQGAEVDDQPKADTESPSIAAGSDGSGQDGAGPSANEDDALAKTMPEALLGKWRMDDLARAPTVEDCQQTSSTNLNFGKVLEVRAGGYSVFEEGGHIITVHARTQNMIDATFDTTYADTPTTARKDFALQPNGTLAVNDDDGDGQMSITQYRRCPGE